MEKDEYIRSCVDAHMFYKGLDAKSILNDTTLFHHLGFFVTAQFEEYFDEHPTDYHVMTTIFEYLSEKIQEI